MQTFKAGEVNGFEEGEFRDLADELSSRVEDGEADGGTIAKMPKKGVEIEINGLKFEVQQITKS